MESDSSEQKEPQPQSVSLPSQKTAVKLEDCQGLVGVVSEAKSIVAQPPSPKAHSLNPAMSPEVIIVQSSTTPPTEPKSSPPSSLQRRDTEVGSTL